MAVNNVVLIESKQVEAIQTAQYTANAVVGVIDKFSATNTSSSNVSLSVNIIENGGTAGNDNLLIKAKTILPGETYLCPELIGHVLPNGTFISTLASAASSLTIRASGREIS